MVFDFIRQGALAGRPDSLKCEGRTNLLTLAVLKNKAATIIAKREEKAQAALAVEGSAENVENEDEVEVQAFAAPKLGSIASKVQQKMPKPATKKPAKAKKAAVKAEPREESPENSQAGSASVTASKAGKLKSTSTQLDPVQAAEFRKAEPELFEVVERLGYIPDCFSNLDVFKHFSNKLGRTLHQARVGFTRLQTRYIRRPLISLVKCAQES